VIIDTSGWSLALCKKHHSHSSIIDSFQNVAALDNVCVTARCRCQPLTAVNDIQGYVAITQH